MYTPNPINTDNVLLSKEMTELIERLAEHVHDTWAAGRIREGWTYGSERSDRLKQTPCLVPYDELPESEKEYDRSTAAATIKAVLAMGFKITKD
ncbi:MAG: Ryanodine receptor Ryr [Ruminococcus sp.]|nr:Ryanodine receptor Ryr [Ruminococcus sp.]